MNIKKIVKTIAFVLLLALTLFISGCNNKNLVNQSYVYNMDGYNKGNISFKDEEIKEIHIDWIVGEICLYNANNEKELVVQEDVEMNIDDKYRVRYKLTDGILDIKFVESTESLNYKFNLKRLRVYIPNSVSKVVINSINAEINTNFLDINSLEINNVSGDINIKNTKLENLKLDSTSGEVIIFNNDIKNNELKTISGNVGLSYNTLPASLNIDSVSGNISLYMKKDSSVKFNVDTVSGNVKTNLEYVKDNNIYSFNGGNISYNFKSVSGNLSILEK